MADNSQQWQNAANSFANTAAAVYASEQNRKAAKDQVEAQMQINREKLAFQESMWNRSNFYNTPKAQMKRFLEAGLNPNLIYGQGSSGNTSPMSVPDIEAPDVGAVTRARANLPETFLNFAQVANNNALTNSRRENVEQDTANKAIEGTIKAIKASSNKLSYQQQQDVYDTVVNTAKSNLARVNQDIKLKGRKDTREERITTQVVQKLGQEIKNLRKKGEILSEDEIIRSIDRALYQKYRVRASDPVYMRLVSKILGELNLDMKNNFIN